MTQPAADTRNPSAAIDSQAEWTGQHVGELIATYQLLQTQVQLLTDELTLVRQAQERERAEKQRLESRFDGMLSVLPAGVVQVDSNNVITEINAAAQTILGDVTGNTWTTTLQAASGGVPAVGSEIRLRNQRWITITHCDLQADGSLYLLVDSTEQHDLGEKIAHYKRLSSIGEMMAQLAHQIRTPLTAARLSLDCIRRSDDIPQINKATNRIEERLQGLQQLLDDLLMFSRRGELAECTIDVYELLQRLSVETSERFGGRVKMQLAVAKDTELHGNPELLFSALDNLINNSATVGGGEINISIMANMQPGGKVQILFSDDGPGIPEDTRDEIFEPFFTTSASSSGLGLAVVKTIVDAHGGNIQLLDGEGACFCITLPQFSHAIPTASKIGSIH